MAKKKIVKKETTSRNKKEEIKEESKKADFNNQTKVIIIFMIAVIVITLLVYIIIEDSKNIEYAGLKFKKEQMGQILFYHAEIPVRTITGTLVANYNLYLRGDPRKSQVKIEEPIILNKKVIMAADDFSECDDAGISGIALGQYLGFLGIEKINAEINNASLAEINNVPFLDCSYPLIYEGLVFKKGDESRIYKEGDCYILSVKDCDILNVTERFMIGMYADPRGIKI